MTRWPTTPASSLSLLAKPVGPRLAKKKSASPPRGYNSRRNDRALSNGSRPQRRFLFADRRLRLTGADAAVCSKHRGLTAPRTWKPIDVRGGQPSQTEKEPENGIAAQSATRGQKRATDVDLRPTSFSGGPEGQCPNGNAKAEAARPSGIDLPCVSAEAVFQIAG